MTCIVGLEHKGNVYMGGDSAAVGGWDVQPVDHPKVFTVGDFLVGYTSSFRMGQLLEFNLSTPTRLDGFDDLRYLVAQFIPAVRDCLKTGGYMTIENNEETGGTFLVGYHGKLYQVSSDFQILRWQDGFGAVGCGAPYAIGALAAIKITNPQAAIEKALEIAGRFSAGVRPPYYVHSL